MAFDASLWGQQATHTINIGQVPSSQSNVPLLITKDLASFPSSMLDGGSTSALNGGGDIRVSTDAAGANQLPVEIVSCVTSATPANQELIMWVRVPTANDGEVIYITWNRAGQSQPPATDAFGRNAVWQDYEAVLHMSETGTNGVFVDSTGNGHDTTLTTGSALGTSTAGHPWDSSWANFDTTSAITSANSAQILNNSALTITAWIQPDVLSAGDGIVGNRYSSVDQEWFTVQSSGRTFLKGSTSEDNVAGTFGTTTQFITSTHDASSLDLFVNGALNAQDTPIINTAGINTPTGRDYRIGTYFADASGSRYDGRVGEIKFRKIKTSSDWHSTEYNNQSNQAAWATIGTPYVPAAGGISVTPSTVNYNITALAADVNTPYDILAATTNYNVNALSATVSFSGAIDVNTLSANYDIAALITTVAVSGDIDVIAQPANIDYTANNVTVSLFGAIDVSVALANYNIESYQAYVQNETISAECICGYEGVITTSINFDGIITGDIGLNGLIDDSDINRVGAIDNSDLAFKGGLCHCE